MSIRDLFHLLGVTVLLGFILHVGREVLVPAVVAIMLAYITVGAVDALRRIPVLARAPGWAITIVALAVLGTGLGLIGLLGAANLRSLALVLPAYAENLQRIADDLARPFGATGTSLWEGFQAISFDWLEPRAVAIPILNALASAGAYIVLVVTYVVFLLPERALMPKKLALVFGEGEESARMAALVTRINGQITSYIFAKSAINAALGALSFAILLVLGVEFAVFWAVVIALANYVPYVGSLVAVGLVLLQVLVQTASIETTILALVLLTIAQLYVANWLEPRVLSRSTNLSPFVVLLSLVVWAALWGLPGAILAVPLTSVLKIVLASAPQTRGLAILMSRDGQV